ncbi:esterase/lipase family protein [Nocardia gamkensis]|uniref:Alpha/beta fold hydrolase n=1 Tax=Nocardia gamkensis TaxID=352869 RepID=A0A7X6R266_9NOCA|nr:alpha/beta fold hydrolase [Nocardia gamkensis]NKY25897.1 alpha/beta fold hydrolase [Nocardia gamkensis]NQE68906.1 Extracellular esterase EstB [Nocardia gamkensis]
MNRFRLVHSLTVAAAVCSLTGILAAAASAIPPPFDTPPGANNWACKPTPAHPHPVVLVHGTMANAAANWVVLSPLLAHAGYCVFAFDYGETEHSRGVFYGLGDIAASAHTMAEFVDRVLAATGAGKVDVVGHSQGGMMPNYYIKRLDGAAKVRTLIGLAPSNHGTTTDLQSLTLETLRPLGLDQQFADLALAPAFAQQQAGSPFQTVLFADGDTVPGIRYAVLTTRHDQIMTPYTNSYLDGAEVTNISIQDQCPEDPVSHDGLFADSPTLQNVLNLLGAAEPEFQPTCTGYGP